MTPSDPNAIIARAIQMAYSPEALCAALAAEGWTIVPVESDEYIRLAGAHSIRDTMHDTNFNMRAANAWDAMIAARPTPPAPK